MQYFHYLCVYIVNIKKKTMNKRIITTVACLMFIACALAQTADQLPYGYRHTIELSMGHSRNLVSYNGILDKGLSVCASDRGFDFQLRYSLFFTQHWGAYASIALANYPVSAGKTEQALERDGRYTFINEERYDYTCFADEYDDSGGSNADWYFVGGVYRYDLKRWSFRGRLGVGRGYITPQCATYLRFDKSADLSKPVNVDDVKQIVIDGSSDVKDNWNMKRHHTKTVAVAPSLQVTFTPRHHMFFSAEVGFIGNIGKQSMRIRTFDVKEDPDMDPLSQLTYHMLLGDLWLYVPQYERTKIVSTETHRLNPGQFVTLNLGIGWNIGWNRNKKR